MTCPYCKNESDDIVDEFHDKETDVLTMWFKCDYCGNEWEHTWTNYSQSLETKDETRMKCKYCDKKPIGVIPTYLYHWYVCEDHAKEEEADGYIVDYFQSSCQKTEN